MRRKNVDVSSFCLSLKKAEMAENSGEKRAKADRKRRSTRLVAIAKIVSCGEAMSEI
jgi:hypothetical protein